VGTWKNLRAVCNGERRRVWSSVSRRDASREDALMATTGTGGCHSTRLAKLSGDADRGPIAGEWGVTLNTRNLSLKTCRIRLVFRVI